jgi:hypothetical protein
MQEQEKKQTKYNLTYIIRSLSSNAHTHINKRGVVGNYIALVLAIYESLHPFRAIKNLYVSHNFIFGMENLFPKFKLDAMNRLNRRSH